MNADWDLLVMILLIVVVFGGLIALAAYDSHETGKIIRVCLQQGHPVSECDGLGD